MRGAGAALRARWHGWASASGASDQIGWPGCLRDPPGMSREASGTSGSRHGECSGSARRTLPPAVCELRHRELRLLCGGQKPAGLPAALPGEVSGVLLRGLPALPHLLWGGGFGLRRLPPPPQVPRHRCWVYDPVFSPREVAVLQALGVNVLSENEVRGWPSGAGWAGSRDTPSLVQSAGGGECASGWGLMSVNLSSP